MSLDDLKIKKHTDPIHKELNRQKEKSALWKRRAQYMREKAAKAEALLSNEPQLDVEAIREAILILKEIQLGIFLELDEKTKKGLSALLGQWPGEETAEGTPK